MAEKFKKDFMETDEASFLTRLTMPIPKGYAGKVAIINLTEEKVKFS